MPACTVTVRDSRSSASTWPIRAHVERDHARRARRAAARRRRRRSCRRRTARRAIELARAQLEQRAQLLGVAGQHDRVGRALGTALAQPHEVGIALAGGMQHPFAVIVAHARLRRAIRRSSASAAPAARGGSRRTPRERDRRARRRQHADVLGEEAERRARQRRRVRRLAPPPPAHPRRRRAARASATDPLQPVERLLERRGRGAADHEAAEAREEAAEVLVAARASRSWRAGERLEAHARLGRAEQALERRTLELLLPDDRSAAALGGRRTRKSARTSLPFAVLITSVKASPSTSSTRSTRGHQRGRWCGSLTSSQRSSCDAAIVRLRRAEGTARASGLVAEQRVRLARRQPLAATEERELDEKAAADDRRRRAARPARTARAPCRRSPAGRRGRARACRRAARRCAPRAGRSRTRARTRR